MSLCFALKCGFTSKVDEMIHDLLIENLTNPSSRERLPLDSDLTLDKALTIAKSVEAIESDSSVQVEAIQTCHNHKKKQKQCTRRAKTFTAPAITSWTCFSYGSDKHLANSFHGRAAKVSCKSCHKVGYFSRVCHSSKSTDEKEIQFLYPFLLSNRYAKSCDVCLSLLEMLSKELDHSLKADVIERIDASRWVSPISPETSQLIDC